MVAHEELQLSWPFADSVSTAIFAILRFVAYARFIHAFSFLPTTGGCNCRGPSQHGLSPIDVRLRVSLAFCLLMLFACQMLVAHAFQLAFSPVFPSFASDTPVFVVHCMPFYDRRSLSCLKSVTSIFAFKFDDTRHSFCLLPLGMLPEISFFCAFHKFQLSLCELIINNSKDGGWRGKTAWQKKQEEMLLWGARGGSRCPTSWHQGPIQEAGFEISSRQESGRGQQIKVCWDSISLESIVRRQLKNMVRQPPGSRHF